VLISLLICTRNRADALDETLRALAHTICPYEIELLVIDNGSTDSTREVVRRHSPFGRQILYYYEPNGGKSQALNTGLSLSSGDVFILTDDDIRPTHHWLTELARPIVAEECDAVSGSVKIAAHLRRAWMTPLHESWLAATDYLNPACPETAVGANMAFHRRVLKRVPKFDPDLGPGRLGLWEDTLFSLQIRQAGYALRMAATALVEHHFDADRLERLAFLKRARAEGRSSAYVAWHWKHEQRTRSRRKIAQWYIHLLAKRLTRWSQWHESEGMPEWEINLITGIAFERHYIHLSRAAHHYERFGLERLS